MSPESVSADANNDTTSDAATTAPAPRAKLSTLFGNAELLVVTLLGIVSVFTAHVSFEASLYDGENGRNLSMGQSATAEAESLYLEGNQQYVQDGATLARLTEIDVERKSDDAAVAELAAEKYDALYFVAVGEDLGGAIERAAALDESEPEFYHSPLDDEEYQTALFGAYAEKSAEAAEYVEAAGKLNTYGDKLTLSTVLMAISLFLLGIAAVVNARRTQYALIGIGGAIFLGAASFAMTIPFTWV
jgi:hypothetical protein